MAFTAFPNASTRQFGDQIIKSVLAQDKPSYVLIGARSLIQHRRIQIDSRNAFAKFAKLP